MSEGSDVWVMRITGTKRMLGDEIEQWQTCAFLTWYDPDAHGHQFGWLQDAGKAKRYPTKAHADADYHRTSVHHPRANDGEPNRPLFDRHTVEIVRLDVKELCA